MASIEQELTTWCFSSYPDLCGKCYNERQRRSQVILMNWDDTQQTRFDELRQRELTADLSPEEQAELDALTVLLTQDADRTLLAAIDRLQQEQVELESRLEQRQIENEELANLLSQQEQLAAESRRWLADFDRRHAKIRESFIRLTGDALTSA